MESGFEIFALKMLNADQFTIDRNKRNYLFHNFFANNSRSNGVISTMA